MVCTCVSSLSHSLYSFYVLAQTAPVTGSHATTPQSRKQDQVCPPLPSSNLHALSVLISASFWDFSMKPTNVQGQRNWGGAISVPPPLHANVCLCHHCMPMARCNRVFIIIAAHWWTSGTAYSPMSVYVLTRFTLRCRLHCGMLEGASTWMALWIWVILRSLSCSSTVEGTLCHCTKGEWDQEVGLCSYVWHLVFD